MQAVVYTHSHENDGPNSFNGSKLIAHNSEKESKEWTNFLTKGARYSSVRTSQKIDVGFWLQKVAVVAGHSRSGNQDKPSFQDNGQQNVESNEQILAESNHRSHSDADGQEKWHAGVWENGLFLRHTD